MRSAISGRRKTVTIALWGLVALALLGVTWFRVIEPRMNATIADTLGQGDYHLTGTDGSNFTEGTLKGAPSAVFLASPIAPKSVPPRLATLRHGRKSWQKTGKVCAYSL